MTVLEVIVHKQLAFEKHVTMVARSYVWVFMLLLFFRIALLYEYENNCCKPN